MDIDRALTAGAGSVRTLRIQPAGSHLAPLVSTSELQEIFFQFLPSVER